MRKKAIYLLIIIILLISLGIVYLFQAKNKNIPSPLIVNTNSRVLEPAQLENPSSSAFVLPLKIEKDVNSFFLSQADVKKEMAKPGKWWINVSRFDPQNFSNIWLVIMGNGDGECHSPHQCYMHIYDDGTIKTPLTCSDGWNCK